MFLAGTHFPNIPKLLLKYRSNTSILRYSEYTYMHNWITAVCPKPIWHHIDKSIIVVVQLPSHVWLFWPHGLQHIRLPYPLFPGVCSNSCPLSQWCYLTISSSVAPFSIFPSIRVFSYESALHIRWPKYWSFSFSISPSNEYSGLISFKIDWFELLAAQGTLTSFLQHHRIESISSSVFSLL